MKINMQILNLSFRNLECVFSMLLKCCRFLCGIFLKHRKAGEKNIAVSKKMVYQEIDKLIEKIKMCPSDTEKYARECGDKLQKYTESRVQNALLTIVLSLYNGQVKSLKSDIAKIILIGGKDAEPAERANLLRCLIDSLNLFLHEDYSCLTDMCEEELERRIKYGEGIEDSEEDKIFEP